MPPLLLGVVAALLEAGAWGELREAVLGRISPEGDEVAAVEAFRRRLEAGVTDELRRAGLDAVAEVHGSVARGTWLRGDRDFDLFLILSNGYDRGALAAALDVVKRHLGGGWTEAYAEHPYIVAKLGEFEVEFVPCFRADPLVGLKSATDRTPLHTAYVLERLPVGLRDDVRLLKAFTRGVGVYGAEIKVGGFSGYLCELLVIRFGGFEGLIEAASGWRRGPVLDLVGGADEGRLRKRFREPMIVVDPVDPGRNVASAVSETSFWSFVAATRAFVGSPSEVFFFPGEGAPGDGGLLGLVGGWEAGLLFVVVGDGGADVPDVLWGQLHRARRAVVDLLEKSDFSVTRSAAWSDEASRHVFVFELEGLLLPGVARRMGPPVRMAEDCGGFLEVHIGAEDTLAGPWVEGDRWWVLKRRGVVNAQEAVSSALEGGGRGIGIPRRLGKRVAAGFEVLVGGEVGEYLGPGFSDFLRRFLRGRPDWLE
jgi:tRNA nucleotidyltransferase (CCA-adding enzyme)